MDVKVQREMDIRNAIRKYVETGPEVRFEVKAIVDEVFDKITAEKIAAHYEEARR